MIREIFKVKLIFVSINVIRVKSSKKRIGQNLIEQLHFT